MLGNQQLINNHNATKIIQKLKKKFIPTKKKKNDFDSFGNELWVWSVSETNSGFGPFCKYIV